MNTENKFAKSPSELAKRVKIAAKVLLQNRELAFFKGTDDGELTYDPPETLEDAERFLWSCLKEIGLDDSAASSHIVTGGEAQEYVAWGAHFHRGVMVVTFMRRLWVDVMVGILNGWSGNGLLKQSGIGHA
jgi:hypothetical protein